MLDGFPKFSLKYGSIASRTSGRTGVVAALSRYFSKDEDPSEATGLAEVLYRIVISDVTKDLIANSF